MNRVFIISDTHFGHKKVIEFEKLYRPFASIEEHDEELIKRWNATVFKKDTVWHLGDVLFGREAFSVLPRLNGIKKLVLGNHDVYPASDYLQYFSQVFGAVKLRNCIMTHIPIHPSEMRGCKANIHGHLHSKTISDSRYYNVSAELHGLKPVLLDTVIHTINKGLEVTQ